MAHAVSPSESITRGEIAKLQDLLGDALRKSGLLSGPIQQVIEHQGGQVAAEMLAVIRKHAETVSDMIVRRVRVDRSLTPQQVLDATGRKQYVDQDVVAAMPRGEGDEVDVYFFKEGRNMSDPELEKAFERRGLKPADLYALAAVNRDDPAFADDHPNSTHCKDADGRWCYAAFDRWDDERYVYVYRGGNDWCDHWWFAGLRK